jgi:4-alpha-glucanotransferase
MKIHFKIPYFTHWGQRLIVSGNIPELGNGDLKQALALNYQSPENWSGEILIDSSEPFEFTYKYAVYTEQTDQYSEEWGNDRVVKTDPSKTEHFFCFDTWNAPGSIENVFLTNPFQQVLLNHENLSTKTAFNKPFTHIFRVKMPLLKKNETLCIIGNCNALGNWSTNEPVLLEKTDSDWWTAEVNLSKAQNEVHYKYGIYDPEDKQFRYFESGQDRIAPVLHSKKTTIQLSDGFVRISGNLWKGAGVGLPVFSIRTKKSFGVGDFC